MAPSPICLTYSPGIPPPQPASTTPARRACRHAPGRSAPSPGLGPPPPPPRGPRRGGAQAVPGRLPARRGDQVAPLQGAQRPQEVVHPAAPRLSLARGDELPVLLPPPLENPALVLPPGRPPR